VPTTYVYEPVLIPTDNTFIGKSGMTTDEAILIKDWALFKARDAAGTPYYNEHFYTTSEIIAGPRRAEQEKLEKNALKYEDLDMVKVYYFITVLVLLVIIFKQWMNKNSFY